MFKKMYPLFVASSWLLLANFGGQSDAIDGGEKPPINFYGVLTDSTGEKYKVENITISGMYRQITVYKKPMKKDIDPSINITRIDFIEIASIAVPHPHEILVFNNRNYIELKIVSRNEDKTEQMYIIEKSKRIICDQKNTAGLIEKDLSFQAVDKLIIEGYSQPEKEKELDRKNKNKTNAPSAGRQSNTIKSN